jgi:hypothetical protein
MSDTTHDQSSGAEPSGLRSYALAGYRWLVLAFLLAGCVQIFLAGLGVFGFGDHDVAGRPGVLAVVLSGVSTSTSS